MREVGRRGFLAAITGLFCGGFLRKAKAKGVSRDPRQILAREFLAWEQGRTYGGKMLAQMEPAPFEKSSCLCGARVVLVSLVPPMRVVGDASRCPSCGKSPYYSWLKSTRRA